MSAKQEFERNPEKYVSKGVTGSGLAATPTVPGAAQSPLPGSRIQVAPKSPAQPRCSRRAERCLADRAKHCRRGCRLAVPRGPTMEMREECELGRCV